MISRVLRRRLTNQQGIAWDRSRGRNGSLYGISREGSQVVEMRVPLRDCSWNVPTQSAMSMDLVTLLDWMAEDSQKNETFMLTANRL